MTDKEKIEILKGCFRDTIWMAIRYAHGRHTYAPGMVRNAISRFKEVFPDWQPKKDMTILPPSKDATSLMPHQYMWGGDYLHDLFKDI